MKKDPIKARIPKEAYIKLRKGGGAHSTPKGKRGYDRNQEKERMRKEEKS